MRKALATLVIVLATAGVFTACSTGSHEARALCQSLDGGAVPGYALIQAYKPTDEAGTMEAMRRGAEDVRSTCPRHEDAAVIFAGFVDYAHEIGYTPEAPGYSSPNSPNVAPGAPANLPQDPMLRSCVASGTPEDQCRSMIDSGVTGG